MRGCSQYVTRRLTCYGKDTLCFSTAIMNIKTKFDLQDEVFVFHKKKIRKGFISEIRFNATYFGENVTYVVQMNDETEEVAGFSEAQLLQHNKRPFKLFR